MLICAIILAAGRSRRMGAQKLLLPFAGGTVIGHIVGEILRGSVDRVLVVVGRDAALVAAAAILPSPRRGRGGGGEGEQASTLLRGAAPVMFVTNDDPDGDMLSSVRCGLRALPPDCDGVLVALGDQPSITADLVGRMVGAFRDMAECSTAGAEHGGPAGRGGGGAGGIVVPVHGGRPGHPILFSARYRDEVLARYDDVGLRGLRQAHPDDVLEIDWPSPAVLADMDLPEDYRRELARRQGGR